MLVLKKKDELLIFYLVFVLNLSYLVNAYYVLVQTHTHTQKKKDTQVILTLFTEKKKAVTGGAVRGSFKKEIEKE